jgi:hypothetical protein
MRSAMHADTGLGHQPYSQADGPLDQLMDALAICEQPAIRHLPRRATRKYRQRAYWKRILRRVVKEAFIPEQP